MELFPTYAYDGCSTQELQNAYENIAEAYLLATGRMLQIARDPLCDAAAFVEASQSADEIWSKLRDIRSFLLVRGVAPRESVEQRLHAVRLQEPSVAETEPVKATALRLQA